MKGDLSKKPFHLSKEIWLYEEMNGIDVLHEVHVGGNFIRTDRFTIPLKKIREYLRRLDKKR